MKYKYTMIMNLCTAGYYFEKVNVSVIATGGQEAINIAEKLVHDDFSLEFEEYISIEVVNQ